MIILKYKQIHSLNFYNINEIDVLLFLHKYIKKIVKCKVNWKLGCLY